MAVFTGVNIQDIQHRNLFIFLMMYIFLFPLDIKVDALVDFKDYVTLCSDFVQSIQLFSAFA